jgi:CIC family chloride channel protein
MTSVFMIFELTQDYQVLVPLMIANMISLLISREYQPVPLYKALLQQDSVHLPQAGARLPAGRWQARDVMTEDFTLIPPGTSIEIAAQHTVPTDAQSLLVGSDGFYSGLVTREQLQRALQSGMADAPINSLLLANCAHVHPDHQLELVLERLGKNPGILPVVSRSEVHHVLGVITPRRMIQFLEEAWDDKSRSSAEDTKLR